MAAQVWEVLWTAQQEYSQKADASLLLVNSTPEGESTPSLPPHKIISSFSISIALPTNMVSLLLSLSLIILMYSEVAATVAGLLTSLIKDAHTSLYPQYGALTINLGHLVT